MLVEQAIFTAAQPDRNDDYRLVAVSPGVLEIDTEQLAVWCPTDDAMLEDVPHASSINFHRLPSGSYCVSQTTRVGGPCDRSAARLHTHCLITPPEVLVRFANDPFALVRSAAATGALATANAWPKHLRALHLAGRARVVNTFLVERLLSDLGAAGLAHLIETALATRSLGLVGGPAAEPLMAGFLACLPVECRTEFSFTTGLKYCPRRPFRLVALGDDQEQLQWVEQQHGVRTLDLREQPPVSLDSFKGWARYVAVCLASCGTSPLVAQLMMPRPGLLPADLAELAAQLERKLPSAARDRASPSWSAATAGARTDSPHRRFAGAGSAAQSSGREAGPSHIMEFHSVAAIEKLEALDDAVYDAIAGKSGAVERLQTLWPQVMSELNFEEIEESREQYLAYAVSVWEDFVQQSRSPEKAIAALDVVCVLFECDTP